MNLNLASKIGWLDWKIKLSQILTLMVLQCGCMSVPSDLRLETFETSQEFRDFKTDGFVPSISSSHRADIPEFSTDLPPGSVFVEAAGGSVEKTERLVLISDSMFVRITDTKALLWEIEALHKAHPALGGGVLKFLNLEKELLPPNSSKLVKGEFRLAYIQFLHRKIEELQENGAQ